MEAVVEDPSVPLTRLMIRSESDERDTSLLGIVSPSGTDHSSATRRNASLWVRPLDSWFSTWRVVGIAEFTDSPGPSSDGGSESEVAFSGMAVGGFGRAALLKENFEPVLTLLDPAEDPSMNPSSCFSNDFICWNKTLLMAMLEYACCYRHTSSLVR